MARSAAVSVENNFSRGLITEVTGVNAPENSVQVSTNVIFDRIGRAYKRKGLALELDAVEQSNLVPTGSQIEYRWETVTDGSSKTFVVCQFGRFIYFFEETGLTGLSGGLKSFEIDLDTYRVPGNTANDIPSIPVGMASGYGYLFITHPLCEPIAVKYEQSTDNISVLTINIETRDFKGVDDGLDISERPTTLTERHKYNLLNQGWYASARVDGHNSRNVLAYTGNPYPSNADIWYFSRRNEDGTYFEFQWNYRDGLASGRILTNTLAPKGHYIFNAFRTARTGSTGNGTNAPTVGTVPEEVTTQRPSSVAFYAGRVFYTGVAADGWSNKVYFTQIIEGDDQLGKCYQVNDPTDETAYDIVASDGGVISVLDAAQIIDLRVVGTTLYVFASNGVWSITGADRSAFKANDYIVSKVSIYPALSKTSIVSTGSSPVWWNYEGIHTLQTDQLGDVSVASVSEQTIQAFYDSIPAANKAYAKGVFNDQEGLIYWLYHSRAGADPFRYDSALVLDTVSGAFYPFKFFLGGYQILGLTTVRGTQSIVLPENVTDNDLEIVTDTGGDPVQIEQITTVQSGQKTFRFLTYTPDDTIVFSELTSETYQDWNSYYPAYFTTGYRIRGNLIKKTQTNYLAVVTEDTPGGSVHVEGLWDYPVGFDEAIVRRSNAQECYLRRHPSKYLTRKLKIRGRGRSLQFRFEGSDGLPFIVVGWAGFDTAGEMP